MKVKVNQAQDCQVRCCIFSQNKEILFWMNGELSSGQTQNGVTLDLHIKFYIANSHPTFGRLYVQLQAPTYCELSVYI